MRFPLPDPSPLFVGEPEEVGAYDAKTRFAELLTAVEAGSSFVVTRHGRPVARLSPMAPEAPAAQVVEALLADRQGRRLGVSARTLVAEGRR